MVTTEQFLAELESEMEDLEYKTSVALLEIYGESGVGKSVASVALAQRITEPGAWILYFDSGQGWASLNNHPQLKERVKRVQFTSVTQVARYIHAIENSWGTFRSIGCIILDECSVMGTIDLDGVVTKRAAESSKDKDPDTPAQPDYNTSTNRVRKMVNDLVALGNVHVILTAHERREKDDRQVEVTQPDFTPKLNKHIRQLMHVVAHLTADGGEKTPLVRSYQVHPTRRIVAKTRVGGMNTTVDFKTLAATLVEWLNSGGELPKLQIEVLPDFPVNVPETDEPMEVEQ